MRSGQIGARGTNTLVSTAAYDIPDDILFTLGDDSDIAQVLRSATLSADEELAGVIEGTSVHPATAANSLIMSNITASGDLLFLVNNGGNSLAAFWADGSTGDTAILAKSGQSVDMYIGGSKIFDLTNDGAKSTLMGLSGDYWRIGDAGTTDHSLNSEDDLMVTGELEVDGDAMFDGTAITFGVSSIVAILGGITLGENVGIVLDAALSADGKYCATVIETGTAGAILAFGDSGYFAVADSKWELTDADASATAFGKVGICVAAASEDAATTILLYGKVRADAAFPTLTIGAPVHIGVTAGDIQVAAPSGSGDIVRIIGYGNTANELFFCPDKTYLEIA